MALLLAVLEGRRISDMVSNWDVRHFGKLAAGGYLAEPDGTLMAFFPGLPVLLALGLDLGIPVAVTGVVLSLAGSAVAAAALLRLGGPWAAVAWLFAPTAVFTAVPYTESLFCAAAFWAWERARADRWLAAAMLAAAACTLRVSGLFLVGALLVMIITTQGGLAAPRSTGSWLMPSRRGDGGLRRLPLPAHRQLDRLVLRAEDRLGPRADLAVGVVPEHDPRRACPARTPTTRGGPRCSAARWSRCSSASAW